MGIKEIFMIFIGGGLGSVARFGIGKWVNTNYNYTFPLGTFMVNILACLVLGLVIGLADHKQVLTPLSRMFWYIGFCGGFSTFSAFSDENLRLLQGGQYGIVLLYISLSVVLCVAAVFGGQLIAQRM